MPRGEPKRRILVHLLGRRCGLIPGNEVYAQLLREPDADGVLHARGALADAMAAEAVARMAPSAGAGGIALQRA